MPLVPLASAGRARNEPEPGTVGAPHRNMVASGVPARAGLPVATIGTPRPSASRGGSTPPSHLTVSP